MCRRTHRSVSARWPFIAAAAVALLAACGDVAVTTIQVASVQVSPSSATITVDETQRLSATVLGSGGEPLTGRAVTWSSVDEAIATVDNSGNVRGVSPGVTTIRASTEGVSGSASVTVNAGPRITLSPSVVEFAGVQNGASPGDHTIGISNGGTGALSGLSAVVAYAPGEPTGWLSASLAGTSAPTSIALSADQTGLAVGTYTATITVASAVASNSPAEATVRLSVLSPQPAIALGATSASFSAAAAGANPAAQNIGVTNAGGGTLSGLTTSVQYTAGEPTGWLAASLAATTAPTTLTLQPTTGALDAGTYTATVRISSGVAQNSPQSIAVTFVVGAAQPAIATAPASVSFATTQGGPRPDDHAVDITNAGGGDLTGLSLSVSYPSGQPSGWLTTSLSGSAAPATITVGAVTGGLAAGTYTASISITSPVATNSPRQVPVSLVIGDALPAIVVDPASPSFAATTTGGNPAPIDVAVTNGGSGTLSGLAHDITYANGQPGGWLSGVLDATTAPATLTLTATKGSLGIGSYQATVRLTSPVAANSPLDIGVTFTIANTVPAPPSGLAATTVTDRRIDLTWSDNSSNESSFQIQRANGGGMATIATTGPGATAYGDSAGLGGSTAYTYQVRACNAVGCSSFSSTASATTAPDVPTGLNATSPSPTQVSLSWADNSADETGFRIERSSDGGANWSQVQTTAANATSYVDGGRSASTTYRYRVRACRGSVCSRYSAEAQVTTLAVPGAPSNLAATAVSTSRIDLAWTASSGSVLNYEIERKTGVDGPYAVIGSVGGGTLSYQNTGLASGTQYFYHVRACNSGGCSAFSNEAGATTLTPIPAAPSAPSATPIDDRTVELAWTVNSTNETRFDIERSTNGGTTWSVIASAPAGATSYTDSNVLGGTAYAYRIAACNAGGCSAAAGPVVTTTAPEAPSGLSASPTAPQQVTLGWSDNSGDETGFQLQRSSNGGASWSTVTSPGVNATSYIDNSVGASASYDYRIRACRSGLCSRFSAPASVTTLPATPASPGALAVDERRVDVSWTDASSNEAYFRIDRSLNGVAFDSLTAVAAGTTSYGDSAGLAASTEYTYRVSACNADGCSPASGSASATTAPAVPTGLAASSPNPLQVDLTWNDVSSDETGFAIERRSGTSGPFTGIGTAPADATTFQDNAVSASSTYQYRIRACRDTTCSRTTGTVTAVTGGVPGSPSGLDAVAIDERRIDLTWADTLSNETRFRVERLNGVDWDSIAGLPAQSTSYGDSVGLTASTAYSYRVVACNAAGCSSPSSTATATTAPAVPTGVSATASSPTEIQLEWNDLSPDESTFRIERSDDGGASWDEIDTTVADVESYADTGLTASTTYHYRLRACRSSVCSRYSAETQATTADVPSAPTGLAATAVDDRSIDLAWADASSDETGFVIERSPDGTAWSPIDTVGIDVTGYVDTTGLAASTSYSYRVSACNAGGCSTGNTASATTAPAVPTTFDAIASAPTQVDVTWADISADETRFEIERSDDGGASWGAPANVAAGVTSYFDTTVSSAATYHYRMRACRDTACSRFTTTVDVTTP